jgi:TM2 domain-containing membrane protein YozV
MTKSTKAALLSGLVFPGIGHFVLKQYVRGSILMLVALIAMSAIVRIVFQQAQAIVDRVVSGEIPLDTATIATLVADSSSDSDSFISSVSMTVFLACWLIGIIDSYRIGIALQKENGT